MKKFLALMAVGLMLMTTALDAEAARRMGGGSSIGRSAPTLRQQAPQPAAQPKINQQQQAQRPASAAATQAAKPSPWRGLLMGAAAALGITALLSALGLSEGLGQVVMMVLLAALLFFAVRFVAAKFMGNKARAGASGFGQRREAEPQPAPFQTRSAARQEPAAAAAAPVMLGSAGVSAPGSVMDVFQNNTPEQAAQQLDLRIPEGFDAAGFERVAKENFVRLQQAWDVGNLNEISELTTDELFIDLTHKLRERDTKTQTSQVIDLTVKLLGMTQAEGETVAVVSFDGAMKIEGEFEQVNEHWVLVHNDNNRSGWLLAGISQVQPTVQ